MFFLLKPSDEEINAIITAQSDLPFSYETVGATKNRRPPADFPINHLRKKLGEGFEIYKSAKIALQTWQMYALDWTRVYPSNVPIKEGENFATLVNHLGFWSLNPCRIVYIIDEEGEQFQKSGFAIGTLPAHSEKGEEQFLIEYNQETSEVFYEIYAFAKAENPLAKIGFPFVTYYQRQFAAESYEAMRQFTRISD